MKYTVVINQLALSKYPDLDLVDGGILDYLYYLCSSTHPAIENRRVHNEQGVWTWVDFKTMSDQMPLLKITSVGAFTRRLQKLEETGFIATFRYFHQKLYVSLTALFDELLIQVNSKEGELLTQINRAIDTNQHSYDNSITDNGIKKKDTPLIPLERNSPVEGSSSTRGDSGIVRELGTLGKLRVDSNKRLFQKAMGWLEKLSETDATFIAGYFPPLTSYDISTEATKALAWLENSGRTSKDSGAYFCKWLTRRQENGTKNKRSTVYFQT